MVNVITKMSSNNPNAEIGKARHTGAAHVDIQWALKARVPGRDMRQMRRGGRVVDGGGLENRCTRKGTRGSNPFPSAIRVRSRSIERELRRDVPP